MSSTNSRYAKSSITRSIVLDPANELINTINDYTDHYFLLDVSGSMTGFRLANSKETFSAIFEKLDDKDRLAIITFDTKAFFKLKPRPVGQIKRQKELPSILDRIFAQGMTAIYDAIKLAVEQIRDKSVKGRRRQLVKNFFG